MFAVASLVLLATVALAKQPHPCASPDQFEGRLSRFERGLYLTVRFAYDETQRRLREFEEVQADHDYAYFDKLYLYNEGKEYRVNIRTRTCNVTGITRPWIPFGVPSDARLRGTGDIGAAGVPGEHVMVKVFDGTIDNNPYSVTVSGTDCIPIQSGYYSNATGEVLTSFYDITSGIADPKVFIPPAECAS